MKRSIFLMIFLGSFFTVLGQTEYPVTQPTQKINESPWYGLGLSNSTFSGASGSAVQLAGYYGLLFKTGNGQFSFLQNGNVGIGIENPSQKFEIYNSNLFNTTDALTNQDHITLSSVNGGINSYFGGITWRTGSRRRAAIAAVQEHEDADHIGLAFFTKGTDGSGPFYESMRISRGGNVGIGTTNPTEKLDVLGNLKIGYQSKLISGSTDVYKFEMNPFTINGDTEFRNYYATGDYDFYTANGVHGNNKLVFKIKADGNVGIGTTNPEGNLQIGSSTQNGMVFLGGGKGYSGIGSTRSDGGLALGWNIYARYDDESDNWKARVAETGYRGYSGIKITQRGVIDFFGHNGSVTEDEIANTDERVRMRINESGNVGIGTTTPNTLLHLHKDNNPTISIGKLNQETNGKSTISFYASKAGYGNGFSITYNKDASTDRLSFIDGGLRESLTILNGGNVGIGTTNPDAKLAVNGTIHTKEVKVDLQGWPDYVFAKEYKLLSVKEVAKYIKENGHLPKMPSAKEVEKNGVLLGEMNKKLLEKIEELTLYTIEQEKEIKKLRNQEERIDKLEQENKQLKNLLDRVSKLEKQLERK